MIPQNLITDPLFELWNSTFPLECDVQYLGDAALKAVIHAINDLKKHYKKVPKRTLAQAEPLPRMTESRVPRGIHRLETPLGVQAYISYYNDAVDEANRIIAREFGKC